MEQSALSKLITSQVRDLGGFTVGRVLPAIGRKMVGPFIFFDHMGPATFAPGQGLDVRPHPHIGLATVTYLFDGAIHHRDSLGSDQVIRPGDINWMTAGSGIVHSERTPSDLRSTGGKIEGIQCWIALPLEHEETAPQFVHHPAATLPSFTLHGTFCRLLLGTAFSYKSPVATLSDMLYLELKMPEGSQLTIPTDDRELGAYVVSGSVVADETIVPAHSLVLGRKGLDLSLRADRASHVMVLGGQPFAEGREIWWNFVASSKTRLEAAKRDWKDGKFPRVPGDSEEFIPLPSDIPSH